MKIRTDSAFISSLLFSVALLWMFPAALADATSGRDPRMLANHDAWFIAAAHLLEDRGVACLTVILIGLIVTWTAYVRRARSAWFVMFVIVWGWAFPLMMLPILKHKAITLSEWIYAAVYESGIQRTAAQVALIFCLMVIALVLPIRSFFWLRKLEPPDHGPSPKFIGVSVLTLVVFAVALLVWVHTRVYEIPPQMLKQGQEMPSPPPPPGQ